MPRLCASLNSSWVIATLSSFWSCDSVLMTANRYLKLYENIASLSGNLVIMFMGDSSCCQTKKATLALYTLTLRCCSKDSHLTTGSSSLANFVGTPLGWGRVCRSVVCTILPVFCRIGNRSNCWSCLYWNKELICYSKYLIIRFWHCVQHKRDCLNEIRLLSYTLLLTYFYD